MLTKRNITISIFIAFTILLSVLVLNRSYNNQILRQYRDTIKNQQFMMHAFGGLEESYSYTNSYEALTQNYNAGYRLFEVDVHFTEDNILVLLHGWSKVDYTKRLGIEYKAEPMKYQEFKSLKIHGQYTTMSFKDLVDFMAIHTDIFVMIDCAKPSPEETRRIYSAIISDADANPKILKRLIVGGHTKYMIDIVKELYDFPLVNLYLPAQEKREDDLKNLDDFFQYCIQNNITSISTDKGTYSSDLNDYLDKLGIYCYVFTINDYSDAKSFIDNNVIIGTDFLR